MTDAPKTGREAIVRLDMEGQRLEARDRALALSIGAEMTEKYFEPESVEDMRDVRRQIRSAAEHAAYAAIQKEREMHAGDMAALRKWADVRLAEAMTILPAQGIEAGTAMTEGHGPKDESPVA